MASARILRRDAWVAGAIGCALAFSCSGACGEEPAAGSGGLHADGGVGSGHAGASADGRDAPVPLDVRIDHPTFSDFDCVHAPVTRRCSDGWCEIPSGCFVYGSPSDEWGRGVRNEEQVRVTLTRAFRIEQHEHTQAQWVAAGLPNPSGLMVNGTGDCLEPECPVGNVTWFEAAAYGNLLSQKAGLVPCYALEGCSGDLGAGMVCESISGTTPSLYDCAGYRLPTDAEWEYAARGGTLTTFYSGDITVYSSEVCAADENLDKIAWYCHNAGPRTHPVGQKDANGWGLYDVSGNAFEWVNDPAIYTSPPGPVTDPGGTVAQARTGAARGGGFNSWSTLLRCANRHAAPRSARGPSFGFRLVRSIP